jgi:hypothetical protein
MWDASGNHHDATMIYGSDDKLFYLAPNIGEPIRVRVAAIQKPDEAIVPGRVWSVPGVPAPAPGASIELRKAVRMDGVDMSLVGIAGAGVQRLGTLSLGPVASGYVAVVLHHTYSHRPDMLLRVNDDSGRPILYTDPNVPPGFPGQQHPRWLPHYGKCGATNIGDYIYLVKLPPQCRKIDLAFAHNKAYLFEIVLPVSLR